MRYFKNSVNEVFGYDEDQTPIDGLVEITPDEASAINAANRQAAFNALPYTQKRAIEYPFMGEYLDAVVKGDQAQIDKYIADCLAVKAKYPKPEGV